MRQDHHNTNKFQDIDLAVVRHPIITKLEAELLNSKPINPVHYIKKWAQKQLKEIIDSDDEQQQYQQSSNAKTKYKNNNIYKVPKRRGAIMMIKMQDTEQWKQFLLKQPLLKNQQCKSRIMIGLRSMPFLQRLGWEDINYLVQLGQIREYYKQQLFASKGQLIDRLYILIQGEVKKQDSANNSSVRYVQGSSLFQQSLISPVKATCTYRVISQNCWICGIDAFAIHQQIKEVNKTKQDFYERVLMAVNLFSCLDLEEMYRLICMVKQLPAFKSEEVVIDKDQPIDKLFLVIRGQFTLCKKNLSGEVTAFQTYREGQFFGQEWLISISQSQYLVIAKSQGVLGTIQRGDIEKGICKIQRLLLRKKNKKLTK